VCVGEAAQMEHLKRRPPCLGASQNLAYYRGRTGNRLSGEEVLNVMDPTGREACEISLRRSPPNTYSIHRSLIQHSSSSAFSLFREEHEVDHWSSWVMAGKE
jgi:hypothetical protein